MEPVDGTRESTNDEMRQAERLRRCTEIGNLPLTNGLIIIQVDENKDMAFSIDGLAPYEVFGLIEVMKIRLSTMLIGAYRETIEISDGEEPPSSNHLM
jgi:hypothetical protein